MVFVPWLAVGTYTDRQTSATLHVPADITAGVHIVDVRLTGGGNTDPTKRVRVGVEKSTDNGQTWATVNYAEFLGGAPPGKGAFPVTGGAVSLDDGDLVRGFSETLPQGASVLYGLDGQVA